MKYRKRRTIFADGDLLDVYPLVKISNAYYLAIPAMWVKMWVNLDNPEVVVTPLLDDDNGYTVRPLPEVVQELPIALPLEG